ncbi:MAG: orotidine-5'-phosphate decarboxylase [Burkholderiaceae bacterium]|jgi:orotidine-5'-phosphate decarboxylase|nr:orotidine-5'-phosphate decarboxylase [Burkholderiaceae bacterium]MCZ8174915.1 orotidine-5'-phosphate decarboxylase [Burkholderiaceae bacterium]
MSFRAALAAATARHESMLCVGLDPEPAKFPLAWRGDERRILDFCAAIVDATADLVCAFKPQIAHFAAARAEEALERLVAHIHQRAPGVPVILDAKRGDIGSTAAMYAREAFRRYRADALTLSPFMGLDSLEPYSALAEGGAYAGKGLILLCRTSNPGGSDLQAQRLEGGEPLFERVARLAATEWPQRLGGSELGLVVGATYPDEIARVRALAPTLPLLIPGVGAQGGDAAATVRAGWQPDGPIVVNASRAVLCAGGDAPEMAAFANAGRAAALALRGQLQQSLPAARA